MKKAKLIAILVIVCALVVVIVQNRSPVQAHFLFIAVEMPVILLLALTAALGFVLGLLAAFYNSPRSKEKK
jgi:uncharacterized integral membrane protein